MKKVWTAALGGKWGQEGGFALVSSIVFLVVVLILGTSLVQQTIQEVNVSSRAKKETRALNLAEAGVDYAAWQLYNNPHTILPHTWSRNDLGVGDFSVTASFYAGTVDTIMLSSTGTTQGWPAEVRVVGKFLTAGPTDQNVVFDHALFSDSDIRLGGTFDIHGDCHANGNVTMQGTPTVDGNLSAVGTVPASGTVTGTRTSGASHIAMPTIDMAYYQNRATTVYNSDHVFNGTTQLDGITFVDGDISVNATFRGKGLIVCTGNATINGNCTLEDAGADEFAIVSAGSVRVNGTCTIEGWVYAHNVLVDSTFTGNGNATIVGGIAADIIKCTGTLDVTFRQATVDMPGGAAAPAQFDAISWRRVK